MRSFKIVVLIYIWAGLAFAQDSFNPQTKGNLKQDSTQNLTQDELKNRQEEDWLSSSIDSDTADALFDNFSSDNTSIAKKQSPKFYQPITLSKDSYGAFFIGYSYNKLETDKILFENEIKPFSRTANGAFFGVERGWQGKYGFMLGGYLNGVAGDDYSLSLGVRVSNLIAKYVIPSINIGYGLQHIKFPQDSQQYNLHGFQFGGGIFVNIYRGFGIKFEAMGSYPLGIVRKDNASKYGNPTLNSYSLIVSFAYFDFSI